MQCSLKPLDPARLRRDVHRRPVGAPAAGVPGRRLRLERRTGRLPAVGPVAHLRRRSRRGAGRAGTRVPPGLGEPLRRSGPRSGATPLRGPDNPRVKRLGGPAGGAAAFALTAGLAVDEGGFDAVSYDRALLGLCAVALVAAARRALGAARRACGGDARSALPLHRVDGGVVALVGVAAARARRGAARRALRRCGCGRRARRAPRRARLDRRRRRRRGDARRDLEPRRRAPRRRPSRRRRCARRAGRLRERRRAPLRRRPRAPADAAAARAARRASARGRSREAGEHRRARGARRGGARVRVHDAAAAAAARRGCGRRRARAVPVRVPRSRQRASTGASPCTRRTAHPVARLRRRDVLQLVARASAASRCRRRRRTRSISRRSPSSGRSGSRCCSPRSRCRSPRRRASREPALAAALVAYDVGAAVDFHWELAGVTVPAIAPRRGRRRARVATRTRLPRTRRRAGLRGADRGGAARVRGRGAPCVRAGRAARAATRRVRVAEARRALRVAPFSADAWGVIGDAESSAAPPTGARSSSTRTTGASGRGSRASRRASRAASRCARRRGSNPLGALADRDLHEPAGGAAGEQGLALDACTDEHDERRALAERHVDASG